MELERTTIRIKKPLIREAKRKALEEKTTMQEIINKALWRYLKEVGEEKSRRQVIRLNARDLGVKENLTREDIYGG